MTSLTSNQSDRAPSAVPLHHSVGVLVLAFAAVGFVWEFLAAWCAGMHTTGRVVAAFLGSASLGALIVAVATTAWLVLVQRIGSRERVGFRSNARVIVLMAPACWFGIISIRELFRRSRVAGEPAAVAAEIGIDFALIAIAWLLARRLISTVDGIRQPRLITSVSWACVGLLAYLDQALFVRHYDAFHHLAVVGALGFLVVACAAFAYSPFALKTSWRVAKSVFVVIVVLLAVWHVVDHKVPVEISGWVDRSPIWGRLQRHLDRSRPEVPQTLLEGSVLFSSGRVPDDVLDTLMPQRREFNVLWVTIDALRADHVSSLGYSRPTTPALDALAREGVLFKRAVSQSPSSPLSFASMFAGKYPGGLNPRWSVDGKLTMASARRFAESMRDSGARTMGVLALDPVMKARIFPDLERGFEQFVVAPTGHTFASGEVVDLAEKLLADRSDDRWLAWVHFFDPHMPYQPNAKVSYGTKSEDLYDGEISAADASLGRLLDQLRRRSDWNRTIVVVHSDHGEEFGDHGGAFHGSSLYQEQVWVPLVMRIPGIARREVESRVQLVDVVPTLHRILGLQVPTDLHGRSLMRHIIPTPAVNAIPNVAVAQLDRGVEFGFDHAVWIDHYKWLHDVRLNLSQWFDLDADPKEKTALATVPELIEQKARTALKEVEALCSGTRGAQDDEQTPTESAATHNDADIDTAMLKLELRGDRAGLRSYMRKVLDSSPPVAIKQNCLLKSFVGKGLIETDQIIALLRDPDASVRVSAAIDLLGRDESIPVDLRELMTRDSDSRVRAIGWTALTETSSSIASAELKRIVAAPGSLEAKLIAVAGLSAARLEPWVGLIAPVATRDELLIEASIALMLAVAKLEDPWFAVEGADDLNPREGGYVRSRLASRAMFPMVHRMGVGSLRRFIANGDRLVRQSGENILESLGRSTSRDAIRATQDAMTASIGIAERDAEVGVRALEAAFRQSVVANVADAVPIVRAWRMLLGEKKFNEARQLARTAAQASPLPPDLPQIFDRLSEVAKYAGLPTIVKEATLTGDAEVLSSGAWLGVLRLTLDERSGSIVGGREIPAAAFAISVQSTDGIGDQRPVLFPLSLRGVLPGETVSLLVFHSSPLNADSVSTLRAGLINPITGQVLPQLAVTRVARIH